MHFALWESDVGAIINGILQNETWSRVLMLGAIFYGLVQIRDIKRTMVTQDSLKLLLMEMRREIEIQAEARFLSKVEHATICKPIEQSLQQLNHRLDRREED
jgi:hypothetical protein